MYINVYYQKNMYYQNENPTIQFNTDAVPNKLTPKPCVIQTCNSASISQEDNFSQMTISSPNQMMTPVQEQINEGMTPPDYSFKPSSNPQSSSSKYIQPDYILPDYLCKMPNPIGFTEIHLVYKNGKKHTLFCLGNFISVTALQFSTNSQTLIIYKLKILTYNRETITLHITYDDFNSKRLKKILTTHGKISFLTIRNYSIDDQLDLLRTFLLSNYKTYTYDFYPGWNKKTSWIFSALSDMHLNLHHISIPYTRYLLLTDRRINNPVLSIQQMFDTYSCFKNDYVKCACLLWFSYSISQKAIFDMPITFPLLVHANKNGFDINSFCYFFQVYNRNTLSAERMDQSPTRIKEYMNSLINNSAFLTLENCDCSDYNYRKNFSMLKSYKYNPVQTPLLCIFSTNPVIPLLDNFLEISITEEDVNITDLIHALPHCYIHSNFVSIFTNFIKTHSDEINNCKNQAEAYVSEFSKNHNLSLNSNCLYYSFITLQKILELFCNFFGISLPTFLQLDLVELCCSTWSEQLDNGDSTEDLSCIVKTAIISCIKKDLCKIGKKIETNVIWDNEFKDDSPTILYDNDFVYISENDLRTIIKDEITTFLSLPTFLESLKKDNYLKTYTDKTYTYKISVCDKNGHLSRQTIIAISLNLFTEYGDTLPYKHLEVKQ